MKMIIHKNAHDMLPPNEVDDLLEKIDSSSKGDFIRLPTAFPHCDCRDHFKHTMRPTETDKNGFCKLCGNVAFYKPLGRTDKVHEHGYRRYKDGCRCELCKAAKNAMRQKSRKNAKERQT